jgi:hypothetical protein
MPIQVWPPAIQAADADRPKISRSVVTWFGVTGESTSGSTIGRTNR